MNVVTPRLRRRRRALDGVARDMRRARRDVSRFLSYALLVLGLTHNWYGIAPTAVADTQKVFVISWIAIVTMLVLMALRLPMVFLLLFALVDASLVLNLLGIIQDSASLDKAAGWVLMAVSAVVVYLFIGAASHSRHSASTPAGP